MPNTNYRYESPIPFIVRYFGANADAEGSEIVMEFDTEEQVREQLLYDQPDSDDIEFRVYDAGRRAYYDGRDRFEPYLF